MAAFQADVDGLQVLASRVVAAADHLAADSVQPIGSVLSCQATVAAVNLVNTGTDVASAKLAARLHATGAQLSRSAAAFSMNEMTSATALGELNRW